MLINTSDQCISVMCTWHVIMMMAYTAIITREDTCLLSFCSFHALLLPVVRRTNSTWWIVCNQTPQHGVVAKNTAFHCGNVPALLLFPFNEAGYWSVSPKVKHPGQFWSSDSDHNPPFLTEANEWRTNVKVLNIHSKVAWAPRTSRYRVQTVRFYFIYLQLTWQPNKQQWWGNENKQKETYTLHLFHFNAHRNCGLETSLKSG